MKELSFFLQVVLKIIKHYQEEGQGSEVVQGVLLGLVVDDRLEITNCFPFPQHTEDDADFDEGKWRQCSFSVKPSVLSCRGLMHLLCKHKVITNTEIHTFQAKNIG